MYLKGKYVKVDKSASSQTGWCPDCRKVTYPSRKAARARRKQMPHANLSVYPCEFMEGVYHLGHLPPALRQGRLTRDEWTRRHERGS